MKSILLIDDSMIQHRIMKVLLKDKYELLMASSGLEGIKIAQKKKPDLILLDYDMPDMSGKETFEWLKDMDVTKDIPVLFLTGVSDKEYVEEVLRLRPQGYLLKPVEQNRLFEALQSILGE